MTESLAKQIYHPGVKLTGEDYQAALPKPLSPEEEAVFEAEEAEIEDCIRQAAVDSNEDIILGDLALSTTTEIAEVNRPIAPWHVVSERLQRQRAENIKARDQRKQRRQKAQGHGASRVSFISRGFVARQEFKYGIRAHLSS